MIPTGAANSNLFLRCYILQTIEAAIDSYIQDDLKKVFDVAVVGGSDVSKIKKQLGEENLFKKYDYVFAENGLIAYKGGKKLPSEVKKAFYTS